MKNKILSLVLTLALLVSMLCIGSVAVSAAGAVWDGTAAASFSGGGDGTKADPYQIATAAELKLFANIVNGLDGQTQDTSACAKLTADIVLNPGTFDEAGNYIPSGTESAMLWTTIGTWGGDFVGIFDGQGHTISGVYCNDRSSDFLGLFGPTVAGSAISNLGVINSCIIGRNWIAGISPNNGSSMINCYYAGVVIGEYMVGGICGQNNATMENCFSTGKIICDNRGGGVLAGQAGTTTNCYYIDTCGATGEGGEMKTAAQFSSGEVTWLLNGEKSAGDIHWFLKNGMPTLDPSGDVVVFDGTRYSVLEKHTTALTYEVSPAFTVTIPEKVTLGSTETISAEGVIVDEGKQVNVALTATDGTNKTAFTVKTAEGAELTYEVKKDETVIGIGDIVLSVNPETASSGSTILVFGTTEKAQYSGVYTGSVTFTVSVDEVLQ